MKLGKQARGWLTVYIVFPFAPVAVEMALRLLFAGSDISWSSIPPYSSGLVSMMAVSIFMHDEIARYKIPDPDEGIATEKAGHRYAMIMYFFLAGVLFSAIVSLTLLIESQHINQLTWALFVTRISSVALMLTFVRSAILLQSQYKLAVAS